MVELEHPSAALAIIPQSSSPMGLQVFSTQLGGVDHVPSNWQEMLGLVPLGKLYPVSHASAQVVLEVAPALSHSAPAVVPSA